VKNLDKPQHPDVTYWTCPLGDVRVRVSGDAFYFMALMGMEVETADLGYSLSEPTLHELENAVEEHEATHA
jgi:hypothetical protein